MTPAPSLSRQYSLRPLDLTCLTLLPAENIYESAAKLLFLAVKWARSIPSFLQVQTTTHPLSTVLGILAFVPKIPLARVQTKKFHLPCFPPSNSLSFSSARFLDVWPQIAPVLTNSCVPLSATI